MKLFLILISLSFVASAELRQIPGAVFIDQDDTAWTCIPYIRGDIQTIKCAPNKRKDFCFVEGINGLIQCIPSIELEV